jgi:YfiH family protein
LWAFVQPLPQPNDRFVWVQPASAPALVCRPLLAIADHLFTTRGWTLGSAQPASDRKAWDEVAHALKVNGSHLVRVHQVHGAAVAIARNAGRKPDADVIITDRSDLGLAVQTADCVPLLIGDRRTGAVAAAHAGWRGLAARVPGAAVKALAREFGSDAADLTAAIGPSIGACCYEIGIDVRDSFRAAFSTGQWEAWFRAGQRADKWLFDMWASTRAQLEEAGLPPDQIFVAGLCTASHPDVFCSYRRDGSPAGRMAGAIRSRT